jgi:hypothetical protein
LVSSELESAGLDDERLNRRLEVLADLIVRRRDAGFPKALDHAELEAAYRFFGNTRVTPEAISFAAFPAECTTRTEYKRVLVVRDTSQFVFGGEKKSAGSGRLIRLGQGFSVTSRSGRRRTGNASRLGSWVSRRSSAWTNRSASRSRETLTIAANPQDGAGGSKVRGSGSPAERARFT